MKKLLYLFFGLAFAFGLSACGGLTPDGDGIDETDLYGKWQEMKEELCVIEGCLTDIYNENKNIPLIIVISLLYA